MAVSFLAQLAYVILPYKYFLRSMKNSKSPTLRPTEYSQKKT